MPKLLILWLVVWSATLHAADPSSAPAPGFAINLTGDAIADQEAVSKAYSAINQQNQDIVKQATAEKNRNSLNLLLVNATKNNLIKARNAARTQLTHTYMGQWDPTLTVLQQEYRRKNIRQRRVHLNHAIDVADDQISQCNRTAQILSRNSHQLKQLIAAKSEPIHVPIIENLYFQTNFGRQSVPNSNLSFYLVRPKDAASLSNRRGIAYQSTLQTLTPNLTPAASGEANDSIWNLPGQ